MSIPTTWGAYPRRLFERKADGSYMCSADASPVGIRCIAHHDGWEHSPESGR